MQLAEWLKLNGISGNSIAEEWGMDRGNLSRRIAGTMPPTFELIVRAHIASAGAVGIDDWIEMHRERLRSEGLVIPEKPERTSANV